ncbi:nicotinate phosphoribosyltransferase [uncultured Erythrobacter sp.]|uniref:nicotinate phosphoribosyltransferase n=1 Tax=uncultured Erythrobacter sp. TaxID=263913 RepID=UPI0026389C9A|nr:nicotinate phosphoribosyltransferase [uncultured Erythrobacter sp.]
MTNLILATDSYKQSHFRQYPPEARAISAYGEARPNPFSEEVLFFGLQPFLIDYLNKPITQRDIEEAAEICAAHGVPFNREGWQAVLDDHGGYLPLEISALPEGTIVRSGVPLFQAVNTDDRMPWLTTFIETALLRSVWYPTTVATLSWKCAQIIGAGLEKSSDDPEGQLPFKLHDFGARGVSSGESAAIGGMAHLVNFAGTDTLEGIMAARRYYGADMPGFSIPAAEHSTMTSWGKTREEAAYANMLDAFEGEGALVAVVSDSYDLDNAVENIWGGSLKEHVLSRKGTLVVRPDSGDPVETPARTLAKLWDIFGGTTNAKGYRVLNDRVRVIQGDGMNVDSIARLIDRVIADGFAVDNIAFGMGGGLLQSVTRDTLRFAMKANAMRDGEGVWHDVSKNPATDPGKASKAGRQAVVVEDGRLTARQLDSVDAPQDQLQPVWRNGEMLRRFTFDEVRERARR